MRKEDQLIVRSISRVEVRMAKYIERPNIIDAIQWYNGVEVEGGTCYSVVNIPEEHRGRVDSLMLHVIDWSIPDDNAMCWFLADDGFNAIVKRGQWISRERNGWYIYNEDVLPKLFEPLDDTCLADCPYRRNDHS